MSAIAELPKKSIAQAPVDFARKDIYFKWLNSAHKSIVLFVTKNKNSKALAKKLRPEISKMYLAASTQDAIMLIEKYNSNPDIPGIDCAIIDADLSVFRLLEYINTRSTKKETSHFAIISTILLMPSNCDSDFVQNIKAAGGANAMLKYPELTRRIFENVLEVMFRVKEVEGVYKDLSKATHTKQFPFLPLFQSDNKVESDNENDEVVEEEIDEASEEDENVQDGMGSLLDNDISEAGSFDSWTYSSSMIPGFVKDVRNEAAATSTNEALRDWRRRADLKSRHKLDGNHPDNETLSANFDGEDESLRSTESGAFEGRSPSSSIAPSKSFRNAQIRKPKTASHRTSILDPTLRPKSISSVDKSTGKNLDLLPFVNRQPRVLHALTIGGLPKAKIESCLSATQSNRLLFPGVKKSGVVSNSANQTASTANPIILETALHESNAAHSSESRLKAIKIIHRLSQDTVVDMQLTDIVGLEKTIRDKALSMADILAMEHAFDQEAEDDPVTAAKLFVKMKKRFKLPHLPAIALGVLYFKQKRYREAIDEFSHAVKFQAALPRPLYSATDDVTALYNRALCYFRVGNDSAALLDLEQAVGLDSRNLKVQEVLTIALRRAGKYERCIEETEKLRRLTLYFATLGKDSETTDVDSKKVVQYSDTLEALQEKTENFDKNDTTELRPRSESTSSARLITARSNSKQIKRKNYSESDEIKSTYQRKVAPCRVGVIESPVVHKKGNGDTDKGHSGDDRISLSQYKCIIGFKSDIYPAIFETLDEVQDALIVPPGHRNDLHLTIITSKLKLFSFLGSLSEFKLRKLASVIEYRPLATKQQIFEQNKEADAMCFVLRGHIQLKMDLPPHLVPLPAIMEYSNESSFGDLEILFHKESNFNVEDFIKLEEEGILHEETDEASQEPSHRALKPAWFSSYHLLAPTELLLVSREHFSTFLMDAAISDLKKRYEVIHACGVFNQWSNLEKLRLARMGFVKSFKGGDLIIEQGRKSDYLFLIITGMCKVKKRADKTEIVGKLLAEAKQKALNHDLKYAFHHRLRNELAQVTKEDLVAKSAATKSDFVDPSSNIQELPHVNLSQELLDTKYLTLSEVQRAHLAEEIVRLEALLAKEQAIKAREEQDYEAAMEEYLKNPNKVGSKLPKRAQSDCDICLLSWPRFFGEICLFEPEQSICLGTVMAESACDVLMVHKYQLQTFHIGESLLKRVADRSVKFPTDKDLIMQIDREKEWSKYRSSLMSAIPKGRWPTQEIEYEQMVFSNHTYI